MKFRRCSIVLTADQLCQAGFQSHVHEFLLELALQLI